MRIAALDAEIRKWMTDVTGGRVRFEEPMARHTSFRVGGPAEAFVEVMSTDELVPLISGLKDRAVPYFVVGGGSNLIVTDAGISGVVICLKPCLSKILIEDSGSHRIQVNVWAGTRLPYLCSFAIRNGLNGMNFALGIPGTVGGAIRMNAGTASGSISDVLTSITVLYPDGRTANINRDALQFSYRMLRLPDSDIDKTFSHQSIIIAGGFSFVRGSTVTLKQEAGIIFKHRKQAQPIRQASAGCIFKNPSIGSTAGELIDRCGLKGLRIGGAEISMKHANFIINTGTATAADILSLMDRIRWTVLHRFNVNLEPEVIVAGN